MCNFLETDKLRIIILLGTFFCQENIMTEKCVNLVVKTPE